MAAVAVCGLAVELVLAVAPVVPALAAVAGFEGEAGVVWAAVVPSIKIPTVSVLAAVNSSFRIFSILALIRMAGKKAGV